MSTMRIELPSLSAMQSNWATYELKTELSPRIWIQLNIPGGTAPTCTTREKNQAFFTGVYLADHAHEANPHVPGYGERGSRERKQGAFVTAIHKSEDNIPLIAALGTAAANSTYIQIIVVNQIEQLQSTTGLAVGGVIDSIGSANGIFFTKLRLDAYCEIMRVITLAANAAETAGGNSNGQSYDYYEQMSVTTRVTDLQKLLGTALAQLVVK